MKAFCYRLLLIIFFTSLFVPSFAQRKGQRLIDSLKSELAGRRDDTGKVKLLNAICYNYRYIMPDSGFAYGRKGMDLAEDLRWKKGVAKLNLSIGMNNLTQSYFTAALSDFQAASNIYDQLGDKAGSAECKEAQGSAYLAFGDYPNAFKFLMAALDYYIASGNRACEARVYGHIGVLHMKQNNFPYSYTLDKAMFFEQKALKICTQLGDQETQAGIYNNIGEVYGVNMSKIDSSVDFFFKALTINRKFGYENKIAVNLCNIGRYYCLSGNLDLATQYFQQAVEIFHRLSNKDIEARSLGNIGFSYLKYVRDSSKAQGQDSLDVARNVSYLLKAKEYIRSAIAIETEINSVENLQQDYYFLSEIEFYLRNYKAAYDDHVNFFKFFERFNNDKKARDLAAVELNYSFGKHDDSMRFLQHVTEIQLQQQTLLAKQEQQQSELDSQKLELANKDRSVQYMGLLRAQADLKTQKTQTELKDKELAQNRRDQLFYLAGIIILLSFSVFVFRSLAIQKKLNATITQLVNEQERTIEQRTHDLSVSNEKLRALISFNAHQIREPLTRITGALSLYKDIDQQEFHDDYLPMLEKAANDLDTAIIDVLTAAQKSG